jgi:excisionase family DNA binding protein
MSEIPSELLIAADVARWLRIRGSTVYAWAASGKIPSVKLNGTVRFIRADIERWLNDRSSDLADSRPSMPHPMIPPTPTAVSHQTIKRAGARAIRRVTSRQSSQRNSTSGSPLPTAEAGERKGKL